MRVELPRVPKDESGKAASVTFIPGAFIGAVLIQAAAGLLKVEGPGCGILALGGVTMGGLAAYWVKREMLASHLLDMANYRVQLADYSLVNNDSTPLEELVKIVDRYRRQPGTDETIARIKTHPNWK